MAFITEPTVRLVSRTEVNWEAVSAFLEQEGVPPVPESIRAGEDESAAVVEISARVCYMSYGKGRRDIEEFITNLLSKGDGSVFEHVNYGFMMTGVSRALTHELVRHRAGFAYSQRSQRFVNESDADFVIPPALAEDRPGTEKARGILENAIEDAQKTYRNLVSELYKALPVDEFEAQTDRRKAVRQAAARCCPTRRRRRSSLRPTCAHGVTSSRCAARLSPTGRYARSRSWSSTSSRTRPRCCSPTLRPKTCRTGRASRRRSTRRSERFLEGRLGVVAWRLLGGGRGLLFPT